MISRMITCLTTAHSIYTEPRFTENLDGAFILQFSTVCPFLSSQLGIELSITDQLELAGIIMAIQTGHACRDHRVFELAHVLYHLCEAADTKH